ncbi:hypothetical protein BGZ83_003028 [Gryganskiella cystojenkinii]|nr:hypothetical protein BGZ83_003028 [Gryganskiella cystojenkinii]
MAGFSVLKKKEKASNLGQGSEESSMTDNMSLRFWCIIDGQPISEHFSVHISKSVDIPDLKKASVDDLKKAIKKELVLNTPSKDLALWQVSIPIPEDDDFAVKVDPAIESERLKASAQLFEVFATGLLDKTIHVIVRLPSGYCVNSHCNVHQCLLQATVRIGAYSDIARVTGKPDRICYLRASQELRMLIEIKTIRALSCNNLVTKYKEDMGLIAEDRAPMNPTWRQVHQIFGYLCHNGLRYGILTTYNDTWFMRRDAGNLWISPSIRHDNTGPTVLQCYKYLMELTEQDYTSPPPPPSPSQSPPPESPPGDDNNNDSNDGSYHEQKKHTRNRDQQHRGIITRSRNKIQQIFRQLPSGFDVSVGKLNLQEFEVQELLGEGRTGRVFRASWKGEPVALKVCDLYKDSQYEDDILSEVGAYKALEVLQGVCIPHFKTAGYDGGLFSIAMEIAGSPMEVDKLSYRERLKIVNGLLLIHQRGIVHNDIRLDNILVHRDKNGFQVRFVDFAQSKRTCNELELNSEMNKLNNLLLME